MVMVKERHGGRGRAASQRSWSSSVPTRRLRSRSSSVLACRSRSRSVPAVKAKERPGTPVAVEQCPRLLFDQASVETVSTPSCLDGADATGMAWMPSRWCQYHRDDINIFETVSMPPTRYRHNLDCIDTISMVSMPSRYHRDGVNVIKMMSTSSRWHRHHLDGASLHHCRAMRLCVGRATSARWCPHYLDGIGTIKMEKM